MCEKKTYFLTCRFPANATTFGNPSSKQPVTVASYAVRSAIVVLAGSVFTAVVVVAAVAAPAADGAAFAVTAVTRAMVAAARSVCALKRS